MQELTDDVIHDIARDLNIDYGDDDQYIMDFARSVIAADRELQSARHAEELEAYALTVSNLKALRVPDASQMIKLRAKGVVDADNNLDCWDTPPYDICNAHVAAINERYPAAMWRVVDLFILDPDSTAQYLKDGETPAERIKREIRDTDAALTLLIREKKRTKELEDLLRSACAIAERQGAGTAWGRFADSVHDLGLTGVTARTYRVLRDEVQEQLQPPQEDTGLAATTKALTFARMALLVVNSGASQKAIALIDEAMNQAPIPNPVLKPMTDGEKIYALWHSSDANDLDDFLDGWRHAEAFHGIKEKP